MQLMCPFRAYVCKMCLASGSTVHIILLEASAQGRGALVPVLARGHHVLLTMQTRMQALSEVRMLV